MIMDVTTPYVEPPPPETAQKRSVLWVLLAVRKVPELVTSEMERMWSAAMPKIKV